ETLPLEAVDGIAGRVRLRDGVAGQAPAPVIVVTLAAGEVQLTLPSVERGPAAVEERLRPGIGGDVDRQAARLARHVRRQRQELVTRGALRLRDLAGERRTGERDHRERDQEAASSPAQSTVMAAVSVTEKPLSPVH